MAGTRVLELPALGPVPFAAMLLADLGADVVRVDRCETVDVPTDSALDAVLTGRDDLGRSRRRIAVDLRRPEGAEVVLALAERSDVLLEGFRPGVAERLGVGPTTVGERNARLVYARLTGWGQDGPLAGEVGHDIGYLAVSGALDGIGTRDTGPVAPLGTVGDYPGGAMLAVIGVLAALAERSRSGRGQVVDAAIVDGVLLTASVDRFLRLRDGWGPRGTNALDGGSHFYRCYRTADDRWVAFGAVEPRFHDEMLRCLGIDPEPVDQYDRSRWPEMASRVQAVVGTATRDEWVDRLAGRDVCFAPVLTHEEAAVHPHLVARGSLPAASGSPQSAPAPRLSRTPAPAPRPTPPPGAHTRALLTELGMTADRIAELAGAGVVRQAAVAA
ncbi:CaiB/BaiF CoA transferase family protein [Geodermatophilus sp. CPCC 205761]|uniref:CaiB/BaiF CoA transferase family protein n=1 Tax=Geodermatophilus sp. CPCC 205761 TaxID=2936597 RepID=UPI003F52DF52